MWQPAIQPLLQLFSAPQPVRTSVMVANYQSCVILRRLHAARRLPQVRGAGSADAGAGRRWRARNRESQAQHGGEEAVHRVARRTELSSTQRLSSDHPVEPRSAAKGHDSARRAFFRALLCPTADVLAHRMLTDSLRGVFHTAASPPRCRRNPCVQLRTSSTSNRISAGRLGPRDARVCARPRRHNWRPALIL